MKLPTFFLLSVLLSGCAARQASSTKPSAKAVAFFEDYVRSDGPSPGTLPVFLSACRGDTQALRAVFSDYSRYGSGDNEAWGDVPDVILSEAGDETFSEFVENSTPEMRHSILKWLGPAESTLSASPELKRLYPKTADLQESDSEDQSAAVTRAH
jgi:hypothetical protein